MKMLIEFCGHRHLGQLVPGETDRHRRDLETDSTALSKPKSKHIDGHVAYTPVFLRRRVLFAFVILFGAFLALIQSLYCYSQKHRGLSTSDQSRQYLWTFGPTAIFVFTTVLWRQTDYAAKLILPWANMAKGPCSADRSFLLDYVSPFHLVALWRSLRNREWLISSTILSFILLKILTVVSTGLFSLELVPVEISGQKMILLRSFNGTNFLESDFDMRPAFVVYGIQNLNLSYPSGTTEQYAFTEFQPRRQNAAQPDSNYTAMIDVFSSSLDCEPGLLSLLNTTKYREANVSISGKDTQFSTFFNVNVSTSDCQIYNIPLGPPGGHTSEYWAKMQKVSCSNLLSNDTTYHRVMFSMIYFTFDNSDVPSISNSSIAVCKPTYAINLASVTLNGSSVISNLTLIDRPSRQLEGISGTDLAQGIMDSLPTMRPLGHPPKQMGDDLLMVGLRYTSVLAQSYVARADRTPELDIFFSLMIKNSTLNPLAYLLPSAYLSYEVLTSRSIPMYNMIAAQVASQYLTISFSSADSLSSVTGSITESQGRLNLREEPVRLMESILLIMICLTVFIFVVAPRGVAPRSPDSIAVLAAVFSRNPAAIAHLRNAGHLSLDVIRSIVCKTNFWTAAELQHNIPIFTIQSSVTHSPSMDTKTTNSITKQSQSITTWYRPMAFGFPLRLALIFFPIAIIAALEATLRVSDLKFGIAAVDDSILAKYCWLYTPVVILLFVGALFNVLEFLVESLEPYHTLSTGYFQATDGLLQYPLRNIPIYIVWIALRLRSSALLAASVAGMFVPFLTIIVSGLFSVENIEVERTVHVHATSWFNTTVDPRIGAVTQHIQQGITTSLIIHDNMSYPAWTYDEVAFPEISMQDNGTVVGATNATELNVVMPALRNVLNCTVVPQSRILNASTVSTANDATLHYNFSCNSEEDEFKSVWVFDNITRLPINGYFNYLFVPSPVDCPPIMIFFGQVSPNKTEHFTALTCNPYLASISVNAVLSLPSFSFPSNQTPTINESSVDYYSDWFPSIVDLADGFQPLNRSTDLFTPFFQAVVYGKDGVPAIELKNNTKLIEALEHVYRQFAAQILNVNLRNSTYSIPPNRSNVPNGTWPASIKASQARLVQSARSTRLLQAILGILLLCAIVVFFTMDARRVLPKPPYTIAAVASLLAGSRLISEHERFFPPGIEWYTNKELERYEIWQDELFRMGWWDEKDGERRFRIDVKERVD